MSLLIANGRVVTAETNSVADVFVKGGRIEGIGDFRGREADRVLDASGLLVIPGGVDVHTHFEAPVGGTVSSDDFASGTRAAIFGGTTAVIDFATQLRGVGLLDALEAWKRKAEKSVIDVALHMIVTDGASERIEVLDDLVREGVTSFKLFMAYPGSLMIDDGMALRIMRRAAALGALVSIHAEDGAAIDGHISRALRDGNTDPVYHALTRPPVTEGEATGRAIALAAEAGAPVYIVHVTCRDSLNHITRARARGQRVFAETCPHYLLLSIAELRRPGFEGAKYVLTPPLRDTVHQKALWNGLITNDLQVVATDHCPFNFRGQKEAGRGDFTKIPNGGPGVEHRMELLFHHGVRAGRFDERRWVELTAAAPAKIFGLYPRKGTLAVGSDADLVLWDPRKEWTISAATHRMRVDYSLYEGFTGRGKAKSVIVDGEIIIEDGEWKGRTTNGGHGRFIAREPFGMPYH